MYIAPKLGTGLTLLAASLSAANVSANEPMVEEIVVVAGSRVEQKLEDVTSSVSIVTSEDIQNRLVTNLTDMFRYDPSITSEGSGASPQALTVRGIGGNRLVYIKDGRRSNDGYEGGGGLIVGRGYFDTDSVKQVEVVKGAASSLYGSDGLGGIVIVTTKDPSDYLRNGNNFAAIDLGYSGSSEQTKLGLTGATTMGEWASSAVVTLRNGSEVQNFAGTLPGYDSNSTAFLAKTERELNNNRAIKFTLDYFDQETDQVITAGQVETVDSDSNVSVSVDYLSENVTAWFDSFEGQLYYTDYEQQSEQVRYTASSRGAYTDYNDYKFEQDIFGARAIYTKEIDGESVTQNLVYGLDVDLYDTQRPRYKTRINSDGSIAIDNEEQKAFPGAQTTLAGLYLQNDIKLKDSNFSFVLGARLDYYDMQANQNPAYDISQLVDYTETALSPKVAVRYAFSDAITGYAQYVAGFKIPPHDQAYQSHGVMSPGFSYEIIPNAELDAEESDTYELGLRFIDDRVSASANIFYADFSNFIENVFVGVRPNPIPGWPGILQYQYQNQDAAEIKGAEAQLTYALTNSLDVTANIGYTDGENTETGYKLTTISPVSGSVLLTYTANTWGITGAVRAVDAMTDVAPVESRMGGMSPGATSSGYAVADLYANYEIGNLILRAGIENLFDKEYIPYQSIAGQPEGSSNFGDYTQPGRNFSLSASYIF